MCSPTVVQIGNDWQDSVIVVLFLGGLIFTSFPQAFTFWADEEFVLEKTTQNTLNIIGTFILWYGMVWYRPC